MKEIICIVCPRGCSLSVEEDDEKGFVVTGNTCPKGEAFAKSEMTSPMRTLATTVATVFEDFPVIPVVTSAEVPKDMILPIMEELAKVRVQKRISMGDVVKKNVLSLGVDIIASCDM